MERDHHSNSCAVLPRPFQSTRSAWSATRGCPDQACHPTNFNPRAPHGARLGARDGVSAACAFQSTRSAWSATWYYLLVNLSTRFQSTRSAWSATLPDLIVVPPPGDFNPRAPHGARPLTLNGGGGGGEFQSTRSAWSATAEGEAVRRGYLISIHALRMERDGEPHRLYHRHRNISIHALRMERDLMGWEDNPDQKISIHALRMERDDRAFRPLRDRVISIHALRMERDSLEAITNSNTQHFNPRAPHGARPPSA